MSGECSWNGSYKPVAPVIEQTKYLQTEISRQRVGLDQLFLGEVLGVSFLQPPQ